MKLQIFGKEYRVMKAKRLAESGTAAYVDFNNKLIVVDSELVGEDYWVAIMHEVYHALVDRISLDQVIKDQLEEIVVDVFAKCLIENFKLTPKDRGPIRLLTSK